jgi:hypothetical protein
MAKSEKLVKTSFFDNPLANGLQISLPNLAPTCQIIEC